MTRDTKKADRRTSIRQLAEVRGQKAEGRRQRAEGRRQRSKGSWEFMNYPSVYAGGQGRRERSRTLVQDFSFLRFGLMPFIKYVLATPQPKGRGN